MSEAIIIALIGLAGGLTGVVSTLMVTNRGNVVEYYKGDLSYCRQELNQWKSLALKSLGTSEEAAEVIEQLKTGGKP